MKELEYCVCGFEVKRNPLPPDLQRLSGRDFIYVHVESGDTRCYPESLNEADAEATVEIDEETSARLSSD